MSSESWRKPQVQGLNLAAPVLIDTNAMTELIRRKNSYGIKLWSAFQRHFSLGVRAEPYPSDEIQAKIFIERPKNIRAIIVNEAEYDFVFALANNFFGQNMSMASGWLINYSLFNQSMDPASGRKQKVTVVRSRGSKVITNGDEEIVVPENVPSSKDLIDYRSKLNISQRQLAAEIGMSRGLLADIELGRPSHSSGALRFRLFLGLQKAADSRGIVL